jgi:hypothetical protein
MRNCTFCGSAGPLHLEHAAPQWLLTAVQDAGGGEPGITYAWFGPEEEPRTWRGSEITVRNVCDPCNHGWMSALESVTKPIVKPLLADLTFSLGTDEQGVLARWALKTAMVRLDREQPSVHAVGARGGRVRRPRAARRHPRLDRSTRGQQRDVFRRTAPAQPRSDRSARGRLRARRRLRGDAGARQGRAAASAAPPARGRDRTAPYAPHQARALGPGPDAGLARPTRGRSLAGAAQLQRNRAYARFPRRALRRPTVRGLADVGVPRRWRRAKRTSRGPRRC